MTAIGAGTRLGPYEVIAPIGAGGMGEVWRGRDTRLDRSVAIKVLPAEFAENEQLKLRFEREARVAAQHKPLTQEGTILGTFQYMAPEQLEGGDADARTDIFALGALLYEMTTGRRAFEGKTRTSLIAAIVQSDPPPISRLQPLTPEALEHVIRKCLCKDRDDRWQSAHDVAEELKWISETSSQAAVPSTVTLRRQARERLLWAAAVILALAAGAWAMRALRVRETPPVYQFAIPMIDSGYKFGSSPALSPDCRTLYFKASKFAGGGETATVEEVFRRRLDEPSATPIEGTERVTVFTVSPDGRNLIVQFPGAILKRVSVEGGAAQQLTDRAVGGGFAPAVAPDGTVIVGSGSAPIRRILADGRFEDVTQLDKEQGETAHESPVFLSDGKRFLFVAVSWDATHGAIRRVLCAAALGSKTVTRIGEVPTNVQFALGNVFYVREGTLMAQPFSESQLKFTGDAAAVASGVDFSSRTGQVSFSVAGNGTIAYQPFSSSNRLTWVDGSGKMFGTIGSITTINSGLLFLSKADL